MDKIVIEGGHRLRGEVRVSGAKNAALAHPGVVAAGHGPLDLPEHAQPGRRPHHAAAAGRSGRGGRGASAGVATIDTSHIHNFEAPYDLVKTMRASAVVLGPLVGRYGEAKVSLPGGCAIGARPIDQHLKGLEALGARITLEHGHGVRPGQAPARRHRRVRPGDRHRHREPHDGGRPGQGAHHPGKLRLRARGRGAGPGAQQDGRPHPRRRHPAASPSRGWTSCTRSSTPSSPTASRPAP